MNSKEKAKELIDKFIYMDIMMLDFTIHHAKQCASICAEELIHKTQSVQWLNKNNHDFDIEWTQEYFIEVKQEIENYE